MRRSPLLARLDPNDLGLLDTDWGGWARDAQRPPAGDWATWLFLGGRGAGKTRAGAEWLTQAAVPGARLALVGPALHDVREVMIEGPSGLRAIAPEPLRPWYEAGRRRLVWPNGAVAYAYSAEDPDSLRGPQFHGAWADEYCAWRNGDTVLSMLRLGLRLGDNPRLTVTTTPRPTRELRRLMAEPTTATTRAATGTNAANLAPGFLAGLNALYGGTRLAAQELDGLVLEDGGSLWTLDMLDRSRCKAPTWFDKVVVGVDPPAKSGGDACGIVVVGRIDDRAYVLADRTVRGLTPIGWGRAVARAVAEYEADWVIAETNQGGDMVETVLGMARCGARVKPVHALASKRVRAEPVAALYEQGRVAHCVHFPELEEEMMALGGEGAPSRSPDRVDALVWAVTELMLTRKRPGPRVRRL